ncbi:hypothetical protein ACPFP2_17855 [Micromonospora citrea]|uniref:hypothetical protein n=1 Tax=Micromonospora citrea TaxID=47855 RepID=UPI003C32D7B4
MTHRAVRLAVGGGLVAVGAATTVVGVFGAPFAYFVGPPLIVVGGLMIGVAIRQGASRGPNH